ncbi:MAG: PqqD family protein [Lachnospiraceae bacterium]|nr:PqqD family protein [Lachnospiraceae bacterium]
MKIRTGFVKRTVGNEVVVVATGKMSRNFNGITRLNESGELLWNELENGADVESLTKALMDEYEVSEEVAERDVKVFLKKLKDANILEK